LDPYGLEVFVEERLNDITPGGTGKTVRAAVAVEDTKVPARNHVEVEVAEEVVDFGSVELGDVPAGAEEAISTG